MNGIDEDLDDDIVNNIDEIEGIIEDDDTESIIINETIEIKPGNIYIADDLCDLTNQMDIFAITLTGSINSTFNVKMTEDTNKNGFWKYEEDKTLKEVEQYLSSTYHSHYTSEQSKTQTLDLIQSIGDAEAFTRSNAIKYLSRFGKKNGKSKMDILKAIHYCVLLYHFAGLHKNTTNTYNY
jgi:hypothetical protein